jgi:hypothetical protein
MWEPRRLTTQWVVKACYRDSFTFHILLSGVMPNFNVKKYQQIPAFLFLLAEWLNVETDAVFSLS